MPLSIRLATLQDLPSIVALLIEDARERRSLDPVLWRIAGNASTRIESAVGAALSVRASTAEDVPGIVERSAEHRRTLAKINPRFWLIHPEADSGSTPGCAAA